MHTFQASAISYSDKIRMPLCSECLHSEVQTITETKEEKLQCRLSDDARTRNTREAKIMIKRESAFLCCSGADVIVRQSAADDDEKTKKRFVTLKLSRLCLLQPRCHVAVGINIRNQSKSASNISRSLTAWGASLESLLRDYLQCKRGIVWFYCFRKFF